MDEMVWRILSHGLDISWLHLGYDRQHRGGDSFSGERFHGDILGSLERLESLTTAESQDTIVLLVHRQIVYYDFLFPLWFTYSHTGVDSISKQPTMEQPV